MKKDPKVLVSILNFNSSKEVLRTIECFQAQTYPNFDLQVIDNASTEDCVPLIRSRFPDLRVIELERNTGYVGGNNFALEQALEKHYDYVLISNHDIVVDENVLKRLVEASEKKPLCGVMGVVEEDYETGVIRAVGGKNIRLWRGKGEWVKNLPERNDPPVIEVDYVQGALVLLSRKALDAGIRFDPKLFLYCDEMDLSFQLKKAGLKAYVDTRNRLRHKMIHKPYNSLQGYCIQRNRLYLSRKHGSCLVYGVSVFLGLGELALKGLIRSVQGHPRYFWVCLLGFFDGLRGQMGVGRALSLPR